MITKIQKEVFNSFGIQLTCKNIIKPMKKIGILFGQERSFPQAFINRINEKKVDGITAEAVTIDKVMQAEPTEYAVIIEREDEWHMVEIVTELNSKLYPYFEVKRFPHWSEWFIHLKLDIQSFYTHKIDSENPYLQYVRVCLLPVIEPKES